MIAGNADVLTNRKCCSQCCPRLRQPGNTIAGVNRQGQRKLRFGSARRSSALAVAVAALLGAFCGALLALQQRWGAGNPVCTSGGQPLPTPICEVPLEASGATVLLSAAVGAVVLAALALALLRRRDR